MSYEFTREQLGADLPVSPLARKVAGRFPALKTRQQKAKHPTGLKKGLRTRTTDGSGSAFRMTRATTGRPAMLRRSDPFASVRPTSAQALALRRSQQIRDARYQPISVGTTPGTGAQFLGNYELDGLGFSLKPPKWLRKAKPGKLLKKLIVPAAVVGATLLIPGAGGVVASAAKGAFGVAKGAAGLVGKGASGLWKALALKKAAGAATQAVATQAVEQAISPAAAEAMPVETVPQVVAPAIVAQQPQTQQIFSPAVAPGSEETIPVTSAITSETAPKLAGGALALGVGAGVVALALLMGSRRR